MEILLRDGTLQIDIRVWSELNVTPDISVAKISDIPSPSECHVQSLFSFAPHVSVLSAIMSSEDVISSLKGKVLKKNAQRSDYVSDKTVFTL